MIRNQTIQDYECIKEIGKGGYATVFKARCRKSNKYVAIKVISKILSNKSLVERIQQEVEIHSKLDHPSILPLYEAFEDAKYVYLALELCQTGNLQQYIMQEKKGRLFEREAQRFLVQIVDGMLYFQAQKIMHRDLKLSNILLDCNHNIKIADFGMATQIKTPRETHTTMCGTPNYISPEIAGRKSYGLETDVWSFGIMLYEMVVGHPPFEKEVKHIEKNSREDCRAILGRVRQGTYIIPSSLTEDCRDLIERCLCEDVSKRIKLQAIPYHPFLGDTYRAMHRQRMSVDSGNYTQSTSGMNTRFTRNSSKEISSESSHYSAQSYKYPFPRHNPSYERPDDCDRRAVSYTKSQDTNPLSSLPMLIPPQQLMNDIASVKPRSITHDKNCAIKANHHIEDPHGMIPSKNQMGHNNPINPDIRNSSLQSYQSSGHGGSHRSNSFNSAPMCEMKHRLSQCDCGSNIGSDPSNNQQIGYLASTRSNASSKQTSVNNAEEYYIASTRSNCSGSSKNIGPSLRAECSPLSTARLKPLRHTKNTAIVQIFSSGEVCVEFLSKDQTVVCNVLRISSDGNDITFYNTNVRASDKPPPLPPNFSKYTFDTLPQTHWKKYKFAARFVELVKARTPKITYQTELAKCRLMENGPPAKFEAKFHTGENVVIYKNEVHIFIDRRETVYQNDLCPGSLKDREKPFFLHADMIYKKCLMYNKLEEESDKPYFPIRVGSRHVDKEDQENDGSKSHWSSTQYGISQPGDISNNSRRPFSVLNGDNNLQSKSRPAFQFVSQENGEMDIKCSDGSRLKVDTRTPQEIYYSRTPSEPLTRFCRKDFTPSITDKLHSVYNYIK